MMEILWNKKVVDAVLPGLRDTNPEIRQVSVGLLNCFLEFGTVSVFFNFLIHFLTFFIPDRKAYIATTHAVTVVPDVIQLAKNAKWKEKTDEDIVRTNANILGCLAMLSAHRMNPPQLLSLFLFLHILPTHFYSLLLFLLLLLLSFFFFFTLFCENLLLHSLPLVLLPYLFF